MAKELEFPIPHKVSEVICLHCLNRFISVRPDNTKLITLECSQCRFQGYVVETGEVIKEDAHAPKEEK